MHNNDTKPALLADWFVHPQSNSLNRAYWFRYILEDGNSCTEIRQKMLVRFLRQETEETKLYLVNRISDVYINDELPDLCMDELAYETGKVFYPMVIELGKKAQWVALRNYEQIKNNWFNTVRPYVELRFGGEIGKTYLSRMDDVVCDKSKMEEVFKNDLFFKFYFNTFYDNYSKQFEINKVLEFPVTDNSPVFFNAHCRLNKHFTTDGYKEVIQQGTGIEQALPGENDFVENKGNTYAARILLESETNYLREVIAEWKFNQTRQKMKLIIYPARNQCKNDFNVKIDKVSKQ